MVLITRKNCGNLFNFIECLVYGEQKYNYVGGEQY